MNFSAIARIPFQAVLAVCDALVESDAKRQARMLSRMYPDMDALNEIEGEIEAHEPNAPYLSWGTSTPNCPAGCDCSCCYGYTDQSCHCFTYPCNCGEGPSAHGFHKADCDCLHCKPIQASCLGCGYPHSTETRCLRDGSISFKSYDSMSSPGVPPPGASPGGEVESRPETTAPSSPGVDPSGANGSIPPGAVPGEGPSDSAIPPAPEGQPTSEFAEGYYAAVRVLKARALADSRWVGLISDDQVVSGKRNAKLLAECAQYADDLARYMTHIGPK